MATSLWTHAPGQYLFPIVEVRDENEMEISENYYIIERENALMDICHMFIHTYVYNKYMKSGVSFKYK